MHLVKHLSSRLLKLVLPVLMLGLSVNASAAYEVHITAPEPLHDLLAQFLDLARYQQREDLNADQFNFMVATADEQVAELVATEGYFSPETTVSVERVNGRQVVNIGVVPGPRTRISQVDLQVAGPAQQRSPQQIERLIRQWPLIQGEAFRQEDWDDAKRSSLQLLRNQDRKSVVSGKSVSVRVDLGGRRIIKKKKKT